MKKKLCFLSLLLGVATVSMLLISVARTDDTRGNETPLALHLFPQNQQIKEGQPVSWYLTAAGAEPLQYQWKQNGKEIPGAKGNTLRFVSVKVTDMGDYSCTITNEFGSSETKPVNLTVLSENTLSTAQSLDVKKAPASSTAQNGSTTQP